jgi:hypothetical protein
MLDEDMPEEPQQQQKKITFVELDEEEILEETKAEPAIVVEEVVSAPEPQQPYVEPQPRPEPVQQVVQVVQAAPSNDATAQQLAKILGDFSFDAIRSEINHRFEVLRRDLETKTKVIAQPEAPVEVAAPATTATFQIETAKIPVPVQETVPVEASVPEKETPEKTPKKDYSSLIMPEEDEPEVPTQKESGGIDIMALLSAQAKKMENISSIEMMELYGEIFTEVTLEELEKYINKHHK